LPKYVDPKINLAKEMKISNTKLDTAFNDTIKGF
jgi:hypothetical protein